MGMLAPRMSGGPANVPGRYVMVLERPRYISASGRQYPAVERRRMILLRLLAAVPFTGLLAALAGGIFIVIFAMSVLALGGYVALLLQIQARRREQAQKLRRLPTHRAAPARMQRPARAVGDNRR